MTAFLFNIVLLFTAEVPHGGTPQGGIMGWWNTTGSQYLSYPGFEGWKFFNLALFIFIMYKLVNKPLSAAFKAKRETIRAELIKAEEEKQAALQQLTSMEARLAALETEKATILERAKTEAESEKTRLIEQTETDIARLRSQIESEIARLVQQAKAELRKFSAEESIRLAEARLRSQITPESDARLVKAGIQSIGGLN
jgi:F-type H+-transporting ATPase subunit b